jgi:SNF2 family DNA or RNA helicase
MNVEVTSRTWSGINKPGGVGRVWKVNDDGTFDVKYALGGSEKKIDRQWIRAVVEEERRRPVAPPPKKKARKPAKKRDPSLAPKPKEEELKPKKRLLVHGNEGEVLKIDKILSQRTMSQAKWDELCGPINTKYVTNGSAFMQDKHWASNRGDLSRLQERFLIKWTGISHLHLSWETELDLLQETDLAKPKLKKIRDNWEIQAKVEEGEWDDFVLENAVVERIVDAKMVAPRGSTDIDAPKEKYVLAKWSGLGYNECTWERAEDVHDAVALALYEKRAKVLSKLSTSEAGTSSGVAAAPVFQQQRKYLPLKKSPEYPNGGTLRSYQLESVNWMMFNWSQSRNSLLADEMGLGKTLQTTTFLMQLLKGGQCKGPFLIVAPLSTLPHWQRELVGWGELNTIVYHGSADDRAMLKSIDFYNRQAKGAKDKYKYSFQVMVTSFEMITAKHSALPAVDWEVVVVDEAQRLKNLKSKMSVALRTQYKFQSCLLLTGTPIQNDMTELWTLLNFLDKKSFDDEDGFVEKYGQLQQDDKKKLELKPDESLPAEGEKTEEEKAAAKEAADKAEGKALTGLLTDMHSVLKPYMLRRLKENVESSLKPKEEVIIEVELTTLQKQYYRAIYERNSSFLHQGCKAKDGPSLMNVMMQLRKCCNHPFLLRGVEDKEIAKMHSRVAQDEAASGMQQQGKALRQAISDNLINASGKLVLLDKLLPRLKEQGHRILIFSQFKMVLELLEDYLTHRKYKYGCIDGGVSGPKRQAEIDRYSKPGSDVFIMLLTTKAGGVGINLTAADTVIIYDSDWNPQNDMQAMARCHRIGQTQNVKIYRLLTRKTYEAQMFERASMKLALERAVLSGVTADTKGGSGGCLLNEEEVSAVLKHGAYDMFREEKEGVTDERSKAFMEENIEQILSRSKTLVHDNAGANTGLMSQFAKASFCSEDADVQVDINDPNFWEKVVGLQAEEEQVALMLDRTSRKARGVTGRNAYRNEREAFRLHNPTLNLWDAADFAMETTTGGKKDGADEWVPSADGADDDDEGGGGNFSRSTRDKLVSALLTFGFGEAQLPKLQRATANSRGGQWSEHQVRKFCCGYIALLMRAVGMEMLAAELPDGLAALLPTAAADASAAGEDAPVAAATEGDAMDVDAAADSAPKQASGGSIIAKRAAEVTGALLQTLKGSASSRSQKTAAKGPKALDAALRHVEIVNELIGASEVGTRALCSHFGTSPAALRAMFDFEQDKEHETRCFLVPEPTDAEKKETEKKKEEEKKEAAKEAEKGDVTMTEAKDAEKNEEARKEAEEEEEEEEEKIDTSSIDKYVGKRVCRIFTEEKTNAAVKTWARVTCALPYVPVVAEDSAKEGARSKKGKKAKGGEIPDPQDLWHLVHEPDERGLQDEEDVVKVEVEEALLNAAFSIGVFSVPVHALLEEDSFVIRQSKNNNARKNLARLEELWAIEQVVEQLEKEKAGGDKDMADVPKEEVKEGADVAMIEAAEGNKTEAKEEEATKEEATKEEATKEEAKKEKRFGLPRLHSHSPAGWWQLKHDFELLKGVVQHGHPIGGQQAAHRWAAIRDDPELSFHKTCAVTIVPAAEGEGAMAAVDTEGGAPSFADSLASATAVEPKPEALALVAKPAVEWPAVRLLSRRLRDLVADLQRQRQQWNSNSRGTVQNRSSLFLDFSSTDGGDIFDPFARFSNSAMSTTRLNKKQKKDMLQAMLAAGAPTVDDPEVVEEERKACEEELAHAQVEASAAAAADADATANAAKGATSEAQVDLASRPIRVLVISSCGGAGAQVMALQLAKCASVSGVTMVGGCEQIDSDPAARQLLLNAASNMAKTEEDSDAPEAMDVVAPAAAAPAETSTEVMSAAAIDSTEQKDAAAAAAAPADAAALERLVLVPKSEVDVAKAESVVQRARQLHEECTTAAHSLLVVFADAGVSTAGLASELRSIASDVTVLTPWAGKQMQALAGSRWAGKEMLQEAALPSVASKHFALGEYEQAAAFVRRLYARERINSFELGHGIVLRSDSLGDNAVEHPSKYSLPEAEWALQKLMSPTAGAGVVVEAIAAGETVSVLAACDESTVQLLPASQTVPLHEARSAQSSLGQCVYAPSRAISPAQMAELQTHVQTLWAHVCTKSGSTEGRLLQLEVLLPAAAATPPATASATSSFASPSKDSAPFEDASPIPAGVQILSVQAGWANAELSICAPLLPLCSYSAGNHDLALLLLHTAKGTLASMNGEGGGSSILNSSCDAVAVAVIVPTSADAVAMPVAESNGTAPSTELTVLPGASSKTMLVTTVSVRKTESLVESAPHAAAAAHSGSGTFLSALHSVQQGLQQQQLLAKINQQVLGAACWRELQRAPLPPPLALAPSNGNDQRDTPIGCKEITWRGLADAANIDVGDGFGQVQLVAVARFGKKMFEECAWDGNGVEAKEKELKERKEQRDKEKQEKKVQEEAAAAAAAAAAASGQEVAPAAVVVPEKKAKEAQDGALSAGKRTQLRDRLQVMHSLRSLLNDVPRDALLRAVRNIGHGKPPKAAQMPKWWEMPKHAQETNKAALDMALLQACAEHGFGAWSAILADASRPFSALIEQHAPPAPSDVALLPTPTAVAALVDVTAISPVADATAADATPAVDEAAVAAATVASAAAAAVLAARAEAIPNPKALEQRVRWLLKEVPARARSSAGTSARLALVGVGGSSSGLGGGKHSWSSPVWRGGYEGYAKGAVAQFQYTTASGADAALAERLLDEVPQLRACRGMRLPELLQMIEIIKRSAGKAGNSSSISDRGTKHSLTAAADSGESKRLKLVTPAPKKTQSTTDSLSPADGDSTVKPTVLDVTAGGSSSSSGSSPTQSSVQAVKPQLAVVAKGQEKPEEGKSKAQKPKAQAKKAQPQKKVQKRKIAELSKDKSKVASKNAKDAMKEQAAPAKKLTINSFFAKMGAK